MRWRQTASLVVPALIALVGAAALRRMDASPIERTVSVGRGQYVGVLAVDAPTGHVYVTMYDSSRNKVQVLGAASTHLRTLATAANSPLWLAVASGTKRVFLSRPSTNGWGARVDMLDASRETRLRTISVPLYPSYLPNGMAVNGGVVALGSLGNQSCNAGGSGAQACTRSGSGVALLDAASGRLLHVLHTPDQVWAMGIDARGAHTLVVGANSSGNTPTVDVFDIGTGRLLHRTALGPLNVMPQRMAVDEETGRAFILATNLLRPSQTVRCYVYVVDTRTGALIRALRIPNKTSSYGKLEVWQNNW